jgi:hypothetical protein
MHFEGLLHGFWQRLGVDESGGESEWQSDKQWRTHFLRIPEGAVVLNHGGSCAGLENGNLI